MAKLDISKKLPSQKSKSAKAGQFAEDDQERVQTPSKAYFAALDAVSNMGKKK